MFRLQGFDYRSLLVNVFCAALFLVQCVNLEAAPSDLIVGVFHQKGPYSHFDSKGQSRGFLVDTLTVLKDEEYAFQYRHIPHGRIAHELAKGTVDLAVFLVMQEEMIQPEIDSIVMTEDALLSIPLYLYGDRDERKHRPLPDHFSSIQDLKGLKVGLYRANTSKNYIGLKDSSNVVFFNNYESAVKSLMSHRIDLLGMDNLSANYWQEGFGITLEKKYYLGSIDVHLAFSVIALGGRAKDLCESYWQSLKFYSNSGFFKRLAERPGGAEYLTFFSKFDQKQGPYCNSLSQ
ncbi:MAG: substrate-binding periplasmic protein [Cellvibrionaceae bacterium]